MNAHHNAAFMHLDFVGLFKAAVLGCALAIVMPNSVHAAPCFDDPQRAYEYLLAQEDAKMQSREQAIVNINRASEGELVSLDGIGSSKAQAIILYREMFGGFITIDELSKVKGIGEKTVEKNRERLSVQD
ncbi:MAG: ComEA family DNA-binding protein [Psychrobacter sp.]|uniref:ComEA family DNA-binding protein n=1 Tax=unclassified Psychrobacter TaxID=196806 RepID=UPI0017879965|nr:ComEA family DNA-binding protein [Psychrobacter sp. FME13]MBE0440917.1 ComEA family DNA-binding protein [Psychrobacter sp. FME13]